jgi:hypothetical protein
MRNGKKVIFFGAAQIKKNYVSFYLMPVYMFMFPKLLDNISPELKKHMQGKSCFTSRKWNLTYSRNWPNSLVKA